MRWLIVVYCCDDFWFVLVSDCDRNSKATIARTSGWWLDFSSEGEWNGGWWDATIDLVTRSYERLCHNDDEWSVNDVEFVNNNNNPK